MQRTQSTPNLERWSCASQDSPSRTKNTVSHRTKCRCPTFCCMAPLLLWRDWFQTRNYPSNSTTFLNSLDKVEIEFIMQQCLVTHYPITKFIMQRWKIFLSLSSNAIFSSSFSTFRISSSACRIKWNLATADLLAIIQSFYSAACN